MDNKINVVMLCGRGQSSNILYNGIVHHANIVGVIFEKRLSNKIMIQRRIKNLGIIKVVGQVSFVLINELLKRASRPRIKKLALSYALNDAPPPKNITNYVDSINDEQTINLLKRCNPQAVVVNGTRIISQKVLSCIDAPFINAHMGVTPKYRGVHGGYWALAMNDSENCGVTVHLVDQGIDTGGVLYQGLIRANGSDNFNTYPIHQIARAIPLMKAALDDVRDNCVIIKEGVLSSRLWYHPTILEYLKHWIQKGVK